MGRSNAQKQHEAEKKQLQQRAEQENVNRFVGPEGVVASELPGGGRDNIETNPGKEGKRTLPQQHGGELGEEGGLRADRQFGGATHVGSRKKN